MTFNRNVGMLTRQVHSVFMRIRIMQLAVSYPIGLKNLPGSPKYYSQHYVCSPLKYLPFEHFLKFHALKIYLRLVNDEGSCMTCFKKNSNLVFF